MLEDLQLTRVVIGISKAGVGAGERLGGDVDGTSLATGMVTGEGSTCGDGGTKAEDLAEVGWSVEVDSGGYLNHSSGYFPILLAMYCWTTYNDASA